MELAPVRAVTGGAAPGLLISAESDVTLTSIDLGGVSDGDLRVTVDSEGYGANTLVTGPIDNVGAVTIQGTGNDDRVTLAATTTSAGRIAVSNVDVVDINGNLSAATDVNVSAVNSVELQVGSVIASAGDVSLNAASNITIEGAGLVSVRAEGDGDITLSPVADAVDGSPTNLLLAAEGSVTIGDVDLDDGAGDGVVTVTVDSNNNGVEIATFTGNLANVSTLTVAGSGNADDSIVFQGTVATSSGSINVSDALRVEILAGMSAAGQLAMSDITTLLVTAGSPVEALGGLLDLDDGIGAIEISGTGTVQFSTGNDNDIELADVRDSGDGARTDLRITSSGNLLGQAFDLNDGSVDGALEIEIGGADTGVNIALLSGAVAQVSAFTLSGVGDDDNVTFFGSVRTAGPFTLRNMGTVELEGGVNLLAASIAAIDSIGVLELTGSGNNLTATGGDLSLGNINSAGSLTMEAGPTDQISVSSHVGGGDITIEDSDATVFAGPVNAGAITINDSSTGVVFEDDAQMSSFTARQAGYSLSFFGDSTTIVSTASFANTGGLTLGNDASDVVLFNSGVSATASRTNVFGSVRSSGDILTFDDLRLDGAATLDTTNNGGNPAGAALNVQTIDGAGNALSVNTGTSGRLTVAGEVDLVSDFSIISSDGATFQQQIGATAPGNFSIDSTTNGGLIAFQGSTALASLTTSTGNYRVEFTGTFNQVATAVVFDNSGGVQLGSSSFSSSRFDGGIRVNSGTTEIAGDVLTAGTALTLGDVELLDTTRIDTTDFGFSAAGADLTLGAIAGGGVGGLTLNSGPAGSLLVRGAVNNLPLMIIEDSNGAVFANDVGAIAPGVVTVTDTSDGQIVDFQGKTIITRLNTTSEAYGFRFAGSGNDINDFVTFSNTGSLTFGDGSNDSILFQGGVLVNADTTIAGTVITQGTDLNLQVVNVVEAGTATLQTGGGNVTINQTIGGTDGGDVETLRIDAGGGDITLADVVGSSTGLANLAVLSGDDVRYGAVTIAGSVTQTNVTGTTTFSDLVTAGSLDLTGVDFAFQANLNAADAVTITNSGTISVSPGADISAEDGFQASGRLLLGADITTQTGVVDLGELTVAPGAAPLIASNGGDVIVRGETTGTQGGSAEQLTVDAGAGDVTLGGVSGANGVVNATGLATVRLLSAAEFEISKIAISGDLVAHVTGDTRFGADVQLGGADLSGGDYVLSEFSATGAVTIDASGAVVQDNNTRLTVAGLLDISGVEVTLPLLTATGGLALDVVNNVTVFNNQPLALSGSVGRNLDLTVTGGISLLPGEALSVGGASSFVTSAGLALGNLGATGNVTVNVVDDLLINNSLSIVVRGSVGGNASVTAVGSISDGTGTPLLVGGDAAFVATGSGSSVLLDNTANTFGTVSASAGGLVHLVEDDSTQLVSIDAGTLIVRSGGAVADTAGGSIVVSGEADVSAGNDAAIALGDGDRSFESGSLKLDGGDVQIDESSSDGIVLSAITAAALELSTAGDITSESGELITVSGDASIEADGGAADIQLTPSTNTFGSLEIEGANVAIDAQGDTVLVEVSADELSLTSAGAITAIGDVVVAGALTFDAGADDRITLEGDNVFGQLTILEAGQVTIRETDAAGTLLGDVNADRFVLDAPLGNVSQVVGSAIDVEVLDVKTARNVIFAEENSFKEAWIEGSAVVLNDRAAIRLGDITATSLDVTSGGDITQVAGDPTLEVSGPTSFSTDLDIDLDSANNNFLSLTLRGGNVTVIEASATTLLLVEADELSLTSAGNVTDIGSVVVTGAAAFVAEGSTVTLDNTANALGTISIEADAAILRESDGTVLDDVNVNTLNVTSGGDIVGKAGADVRVPQSSRLVAAGDINLSRELALNIELGTVSLTGEVVTLLASDRIRVGDVTASDLTLDTESSISQSAGTSVQTDGTSTLNSGGAIVLDNAGNNFNDVTFNATTSATLRDASGLSVSGDNSAGQALTIETGGDLTFAQSAIVTAADTIISAGGEIRQDEGSEIEVLGFALSADGGFTQAGDTTLTVGGDLLLSTSGPIVQSATASISVTGLTGLDAGSANITLPGASNNFGTVALNGGLVVLADSNSLNLANVSVASLDIDAGISVGNVADAFINVDGVARFAVGGEVNLGVASPAGLIEFGALDVTATNAALVLTSPAVLQGVDVNRLTLTADGISQTGVVAVRDTADLTAQSASIFLGGIDGSPDNEIASAKMIADDISVVVGGSIEVLGVAAAGSLAVTSIAGDISEATGALVQADNAVFVAEEGNITLDANNRFEDVRIDGLAVELTQDNDIVFDGGSSASSLIANGASVSQTAGSSIRVTGSTSLTATGPVTLSNAGNNFSVVDVAAPGVDVEITDVDDIVFSELVARNVLIVASGIRATSGDVSVSSAVLQSAGADVVIGGGAVQSVELGELSVIAASVLVADDQSLDLGVVDITGDFNLDAGGDVTSSAPVSVGGQVNITATGSVTLDNAANNLGPVTIDATDYDVSLVENETIDISRIKAGRVQATASSGSVVVANIEAGTGGVQLSSDEGDVRSTGTILSAGNVSLNARNAVTLAGDSSVSGGMSVISDTSSIESTGVLAVSGPAAFSADGNIDLTSGQNSFGSIALSGAEAVVVESDATSLGEVNLNELVLTSGGDIRDLNDETTISVSGLLSLEAEGNNIELAGTKVGSAESLVDVGSVEIVAADAVELVLGSSAVLGNITAESLRLIAPTIEGQTGATINLGSAALTADATSGASIVLTASTNTLDVLVSLKADDAELHLDSGDLELDQVAVDGDLILHLATGNLTDNDDAVIEVTGQTTLSAAAGNVTLGDGAAQVTFGDLNVTTGTLVLEETDAIVIESLQVAAATLFARNGNITGTSDWTAGDLNLRGGEVNISLAGDTTITTVEADQFEVVSDGSVSIAGLAGRDVSVSGNVSITAESVTFADGGSVRVGSLSVAAGTVDVANDLRPFGGETTIAGGAVTIAATTTTIGNPSRPQVIVETTGGPITFAGGAGDNGDLTVIGDVLLDTTNRSSTYIVTNPDVPAPDAAASAAPGAAVRLLTSGTEVGNIGGTTGLDRLIVVAGDGDVSMGNVVQAGDDAINTLQIVAGDILLADVSTDGNTVDLDATGNISVTGLLRDDGGPIELTASGTIRLAGPVTAAGALLLESTALQLGVGDAIRVSAPVHASDVVATGVAGNIIFSDTVTTTGLATGSSGALTVQNAGVIAFAGDVDSSGTVTVESLAAPGNLRDDSLATVTDAVRADGNVSGGHINITAATGNVVATGGLLATGENGQAGGVILSVQDGDASLSNGTVENAAVIAQSGDFDAAVSGKLSLLGSASSAGTVRVQAGEIEARNTITGAAIRLNAVSQIDITVAGVGEIPGDGLRSTSGSVELSSTEGDITLGSNVDAATDLALLAVSGSVAQAKNSVARARGGAIAVSALNGIKIASLVARDNVTLAINRQVKPGEEAPNFERVNDQIAFEDSGDINAGKLSDITSERGAIIFLAPAANVGSVAADQNFVQRAASGIFYGLDEGRFFSDDIGSTSLLQTVPDGAVVSFGSLLNGSLASFSFDQFDPGIVIGDLLSNLGDATRATASAGDTTAASSSRSTAASQRKDEEEVAEVDEQAFADLITYDLNPDDSIRLPEDQVDEELAIDSEGNMLFLVNSATDRPYDGKFWVLYEVRLGLIGAGVPGTSVAAGDSVGEGVYLPGFVSLETDAPGGGAD